jgi:hypothetical protein
MVVTLFEEQVDALAESLKGELTSESLAGELRVTPARAGRESVSMPQHARRALRRMFMRQSPLNRNRFTRGSRLAL